MSHFSKIELRFVSHVRIGDIIQVSLKLFPQVLLRNLRKAIRGNNFSVEYVTVLRQKKLGCKPKTYGGTFKVQQYTITLQHKRFTDLFAQRSRIALLSNIC